MKEKPIMRAMDHIVDFFIVFGLIIFFLLEYVSMQLQCLLCALSIGCSVCVKLLALYSACKSKKKAEEKEIYVNYFSLILFILVKIMFIIQYNEL